MTKPADVAAATLTVLTLLFGLPNPAPCQAPSSTSDLRSIWTPGSIWINTKALGPHEKEWRVDSFDGDKLTVSRRSEQSEGRVVFVLETGALRSLRVVDAAHVGTLTPVDLRNHRGDGWIDRDALDFSMTAEIRQPRSQWRRWTTAVHLVSQVPEAGSSAPEQALTIGARLTGRRNAEAPAHGRGPATMKGEVVKLDARELVIRAEETWRSKSGRTIRATWLWHFERNGRDEAGNPVWMVKPGIAADDVRPNESTNHRFNWRGSVVWRDGKLEGEYWFDWRTMENPGRMDVSHPLVLELERSPDSNSSAERAGADGGRR